MPMKKYKIVFKLFLVFFFVSNLFAANVKQESKEEDNNVAYLSLQKQVSREYRITGNFKKDNKYNKKYVVYARLSNDKQDDTEKDALDNYESEIEETSIIGYLSKLVEKGYDRNACLEKTANAFGIDKETMLEAIKEELLKRGKVKQTDKGDYYIGD